MRYFSDRAGFKKDLDLAREIGVSPSTVSLWLSDKVEPTQESLARFCRACRITLAEFWAAPIVIVPAVGEG